MHGMQFLQVQRRQEFGVSIYLSVCQIFNKLVHYNNIEGRHDHTRILRKMLKPVAVWQLIRLCRWRPRQRMEGRVFVFLLPGNVWHETPLWVRSRAAALRGSVTMLFMCLSTPDGLSERSRSHVDSRELG